MTTEIAYERRQGSAAEIAALLLPLCAEIFPGFDGSYLTRRLPTIQDVDLWLAREGERVVGFKLGYRRGPQLLYSWLGGVHPSARRAGVAGKLMELQHRHAAEAGYGLIETRTRASNNAMIILNLRSGFTVTGFEIDSAGIPIVTQRKDLCQPT
ncbi:MAG: GNAT family N-acetyltransferase [Sphingomonas sp.]